MLFERSVEPNADEGLLQVLGMRGLIPPHLEEAHEEFVGEEETPSVGHHEGNFEISTGSSRPSWAGGGLA